MSNLLDYVGLGYFLEKIKTLFVTALGTSGNSLTWTKNGTTSNITVPYATKAGKLSVTSTDNAVVRFDGTSGNVQNSGVTINDSNHVTAAKFITSGGTSSQFVKGDGSLAGDVKMNEVGWVGAGHSELRSLENLYYNVGANVFAFLNTDYVSVEYTNDGGTTWVDYEATAKIKTDLFTLEGTVYVGRKNESTSDKTSNDAVRVTVSKGCGLYALCKFLIVRVWAAGGCSLKVEYTTYADPTTFVEHKTYSSLNGNPGLLIIPFDKYLFGNSGVHDLRFVYSYNGGTTYVKLPKYFGHIRAYCNNVYSAASNYAKTGHLYTINSSKKATFPGDVAAVKFIKSGGTSSQFLKADGSVDSTAYGTYSKPSGGIPKSDLSSAVQTSLGKADTALQSHQDISGKVDKVTSTDNAVVRFDGTSGAVQNSIVKIDDNGNVTMPAYATLKLEKWIRYLTISGNDIVHDLTNVTGGYAGSFYSVKTKGSDGEEYTTVGLGFSGNNGSAKGLSYLYAASPGKSYSNPDIKFNVDGTTNFLSSVTAPTAASGTNNTQVATTAFVNTAISGKQNTISDLDTIRSGASAGATAYQKPSGGIPKTDLASAVQTSLGKADTALLSYTETDPTVPSWAKQSSKPTYTAQEVGALPSTTSIPSKTSDLTNDSGFITTSDISGVYKYKGTKTNYSNLPTSGNVTGDVWNVTNANGNIPAGTNYAWNGSAWDALGGSVDLSGYVPTSRTINGKPLSANVTLSASDVSALPSSTTIPTALADLTDDSTHRVVTDTEKSTWNGKLNPATTLAGYGITDAKIQNGVITLGSNTITPLTSHLSLSNYVNLNGAQSITGEKTFTGDKRIKFKLGTASDKLGFTLYTKNNVEAGYLEWQSSGLNSKPTLVLGLWISLLKPSTPGYLGFKLVNVLTATRYMLVTPLLADAKTPLELNDTIKTFYFPLLFKNGTAKVVTANTGEVDLSTLMLAYESANNKVTSIDSSSTDTLYPSAKCVYEAILNNSSGDYVFIEGTDIYADFTPTSSNFSFILGASNYNDF